MAKNETLNNGFWVVWVRRDSARGDVERVGVTQCGESCRVGGTSGWGDLERKVVKLTLRIDQGFQGVTQAEVQNDHRRKNLIADLVHQILNHHDKEKLITSCPSTAHRTTRASQEENN